jgi:MarR family 2-MHQ and catechol resistance regulon transcriptional repressor
VFTAHREDYYLERLHHYGPTYPHFDFQTSELILNIIFTYDVLHQCTSKYMAEFGLSKSTFNVLLLLRHGPAEGMQLHDLGEMLLVSRANVTGLISHLEERGFVTREVNEQDRRARYAKATPKAEALLDQLMPIHYRNIRSLMSSLSNSAKNEIIGLLGQVRQSIQQNSELCDQPAGAKL